MYLAVHTFSTVRINFVKLMPYPLGDRWRFDLKLLPYGTLLIVSIVYS